MKQIRRNLFETNSSSTHAITIANNTDDDFKNNLPKVLELELGEFGWEYDRHQTISERASYLFTAIVYNGWVEEYMPKLVDTLKKWGVEVRYPELKKIESEYRPGDFYFEPVEGRGYFYIDHGFELKDFVEKLFSDETLLMNYLFSPESFVSTGNDNDEDDVDTTTNAKNILFEYYKGN